MRVVHVWWGLGFRVKGTHGDARSRWPRGRHGAHPTDPGAQVERADDVLAPEAPTLMEITNVHSLIDEEGAAIHSNIATAPLYDEVTHL